MKQFVKENGPMILLIGFWVLVALYDLAKTALTN